MLLMRSEQALKLIEERNRYPNRVKERPSKPVTVTQRWSLGPDGACGGTGRVGAIRAVGHGLLPATSSVVFLPDEMIRGATLAATPRQHSLRGRVEQPNFVPVSDTAAFAR